MHSVKKINYIDGFKICVTFEDKKIKLIDVEPYLKKGIFKVLKDPEYFNLAKVEYDTLVWPNEADFCADVLYEIGKEVTLKKQTSKVVRRKQVKQEIARSCLST